MIDKIIELDKALFLFLNNLYSDSWDSIMWWISGKTQWIPFYILITAIIAIKYRWHTFIILLFIGLLISASDSSSVHLFKEVFERLRPCHNPQISDLIHIVNNKCGGKYGFVSSHASNTFALASFLWYLYQKNRYIGVIMFLWAAIVSYSRIYLGVHYPADILGGAALGIFTGFILYKLLLLTNQKLLKNKLPIRTNHVFYQE